MKDEKLALSISVRELVEFIMRSGDIDNRSTSQVGIEAMLEGSRLHKWIQDSMDDNYHPEVSMKTIWDATDYSITVEGRADGVIIDDGRYIIDEIKTMYASLEKMSKPLTVHKAQAMCYGYMCVVKYDLKNIGIQMTYCNISDKTIKRFNYEYESEEIIKWFGELMEKYIRFTDFVFKEKDRVVNSIQPLEFPFEYRPGQKQVMSYVYSAVDSQENLFIQAPTGVGKTISVIYPALKNIGNKKADKIFYLTAKTVTRSVAMETFDILRKAGLHFKTIALTAKEKICPMEEMVCNPVKCIRAKGHFDRINEAIYDIITHEQGINREIIEKYALKHNVCPFEMSLDVSNFMDGIICDYNYVFDPSVKLKRYFTDGIQGNYVFLVDEAHNLVDRAREMYSASLTKEDFLQVRKIVEPIDKHVAKCLLRCNRKMLELKRQCVGTGKYTYTIISETDELNSSLKQLESAMENMLDKHKEFHDRETTMDLYFSIKKYLEIHSMADSCYIHYTDFKDNGDFFVKLFCVNPSNNLKDCMNTGLSTILFSATLLPVNFYKEMLSGNSNDKAIYINSPFDVRKRYLGVSRDVSSRYDRRNQREYEKIIKTIENVVSQCQGNYMVFFPSYKYMQDIKELIDDMGRLKNANIIMQQREMDEIAKENFLDEFKDYGSEIKIGFCVLGGVFSEGIDLKNECLIGSLIIGTGLPMINSEGEILKNYFDEHNKNGFNYAYRYPGMNKVEQAAGRVIRTSEDYGVIILMDDRFLNWDYKGLFPREWSDYKVIDCESVGEDVKHFWRYV